MGLEYLNKSREKQSPEGDQTSRDVVNRIQDGLGEIVQMENVGVLCNKRLYAEFGTFPDEFIGSLEWFIESETGYSKVDHIDEGSFENLFGARKKSRADFIAKTLKEQKINKGGNK